MIRATAGYPGEAERVTQEIHPPQPAMGLVCVWCGEVPCEWSEVSKEVVEFHRHVLLTIRVGELPPPNVMRKRMYRQVAIMRGFVRREKHSDCVHQGIRNISPSPDGHYMGHKLV